MFQLLLRCLLSYQIYVCLLVLCDIVAYIALILFFHSDFQTFYYLNIVLIIGFTVIFLIELKRRLKWICQLKSFHTNQAHNQTLVRQLHRAIGTSVQVTFLMFCFLLILTLTVQLLSEWILFGVYVFFMCVLQLLYCFRDKIRQTSFSNLFYEFLSIPASLPATATASTLVTAIGENSCPICLDVYEQSTKIVKIPCGHVFHYVCIDLWMMKSTTCPLCRQDVEFLPENTGSTLAVS